MELIGRVLWWSDEDRNGILIDLNGNEFYFDHSVLELKPRQSIKRKTVLVFEYNDKISDCLCAKNVKVANTDKKKAIEKKFRQESLTNL